MNTKIPEKIRPLLKRLTLWDVIVVAVPLGAVWQFGWPLIEPAVADKLKEVIKEHSVSKDDFKGLSNRVDRLESHAKDNKQNLNIVHDYLKIIIQGQGKGQPASSRGWKK